MKAYDELWQHVRVLLRNLHAEVAWVVTDPTGASLMCSSIWFRQLLPSLVTECLRLDLAHKSSF